LYSTLWHSSQLKPWQKIGVLWFFLRLLAPVVNLVFLIYVLPVRLAFLENNLWAWFYIFPSAVLILSIFSATPQALVDFIPYCLFEIGFSVYRFKHCWTGLLHLRHSKTWIVTQKSGVYRGQSTASLLSASLHSSRTNVEMQALTSRAESQWHDDDARESDPPPTFRSDDADSKNASLAPQGLASAFEATVVVPSGIAASESIAPGLLGIGAMPVPMNGESFNQDPDTSAAGKNSDAAHMDDSTARPGELVISVPTHDAGEVGNMHALSLISAGDKTAGKASQESAEFDFDGAFSGPMSARTLQNVAQLYAMPANPQSAASSSPAQHSAGPAAACEESVVPASSARSGESRVSRWGLSSPSSTDKQRASAHKSSKFSCPGFTVPFGKVGVWESVLALQMLACAVYAFRYAHSPSSASYFLLATMGLASMVFYKYIDARLALPTWIRFSPCVTGLMSAAVLAAVVFAAILFATPPRGGNGAGCSNAPPSGISCVLLRNQGLCNKYPGYCENTCGKCGPYAGFSDAAAVHPFSNGAGNFFINGVNGAWLCHGCDFGHDDWYFDVVLRPQFERDLRNIRHHGGNMIRSFVYGSFQSRSVTQWSPISGKLESISPYVIVHLKTLLRMAQKHNVYVLLTLVNGAQDLHEPRLISDLTVMQSFIEVGVIPVVEALQGHPALFGYDIINEPEGMVTDFNNAWAWPHSNMSFVQRFVGRVAHAIHQTDQKAMVSDENIVAFAS